jgi:gliding motility-associated-like protein
MQNTSHRYENAGNYVVNLQANASNGCQSETVAKTVGIKSAAVAFAGLDTSVIQGVPFQLRGQGNGTLRWSPAGGLSDPASPNPIVTLVNDQQFILTVTTEEGCTATDAVLVRTFNGPAIYVPTAFTPNGDGKNEVLRPVYVGIKELKQFVVFNRWGQQLFSTKDMGRGWEGRTATSGTYVWLVQAVDANGRLVTLKGTVTVIR